MAVSISNLAKCEVRAVIQFIYAKGEISAKFITSLFLFMAKMLRTGTT
jgi:hypothetical protein